MSTHRTLVTAPELKNLIDNKNQPVTLDVRWTLTEGAQPDAYNQGHIPLAVFVDAEQHFTKPAGDGGRHPLPDMVAVQQFCARTAMAPDTEVVVYDDFAGLAAGRAWWCLTWAGMTNVRILDGGWSAWQGAAGPTTTDSTSIAAVITPGDWPDDPQLPTVTADRMLDDDILAIDVRAAERYRGEVEPIDPAAGHIPGAVNAPLTDFVDSQGSAIAADEFRARLDAALQQAGESLSTRKTLVAYCGSGMTAAAFVGLAAHAGVDVTLYPGSWSQWCSDPERPIATGPTP